MTHRKMRVKGTGGAQHLESTELANTLFTVMKYCIVELHLHSKDSCSLYGTVSREKLFNCGLGEMDWTLIIDFLGFYIFLIICSTSTIV